MIRKRIIFFFLILLFMGGGVAFVSSTFENAVFEMKGQRYTEARPKLEWLSMFGHAHAQRLLGEMYAYGWGVDRNRESALKLLRRSAYRAKGLKDPAAYAAYYIGQDFSNGTRVAHDCVEAEWWLKLAKDGGYSAESAVEMR